MDSPTYHLERVVKVREDEQLQDFSGPLDLILHLLSKNKMEIKDIQIAMILEQYLAWMEERKTLDLEIASEFVTMASHLVFIKSRMLLSVNDEEALSEMEQLIASLEEHQRHESYLKVKAVIPQLAERYDIGRDHISKPPEDLSPDKTYRCSHEAEELFRTICSVLERADRLLPPSITAFEGIVGREPYSVTDKAMEIVGRLIRFGVTRFRSLFRGNRSRSEIVATFIAVLELCRARRVLLAGDERDCTVTCTGEAKEPLPEFSAEEGSYGTEGA